MAYEGVGGVGFLLGTLLGKALGGETAGDRERKRKKALGQYATSLFEQPLTEAESGLFRDAPLEAFQLGVKREDERRRLRQRDEDAAKRFSQQKELIEFREQKQKEYSTSGAAKGPTTTQQARFDKTGAYLSRLAQSNPRMAAFLDEAKRLEAGQSDPDRYRTALEAAFAPLIDESRAIEGRKIGSDYRTPADQARAAELADLDRAMADSYLFGRVPRAGAPAPAGTPGSAGAAAPPPRGTFTPEPVSPATAQPTDLDMQFEALKESGADLDAVARTLRGMSLAELQADGLDAAQRDYLLSRIDQEGLSTAPPDVQAQAPQVAAMQRTPLGETAELGLTLGNLGANTARAAASSGIFPGVDPSGGSPLFDTPGVPIGQGPARIPQTPPDPIGFARGGEEFAQRFFADDGAQFAPPMPNTSPAGSPDVMAALEQLFDLGAPAQPTQAEPGRNVFGVGGGTGRSTSNPNADIQPTLPGALAPDELAEIQEFLIREEKRRRIEKILGILAASVPQ